jgi:Na+-driven multidrug efflux pump
MVPLGFQEAHCTVIGNSMGENNPNLARKYFRLTAIIALSVIFTWIGFAFTFRDYISSIYIVVKDEETE